jgi:hypothetical protein
MNAHDESIQIASDVPEKANKELTNIDVILKKIEILLYCKFI